MRGKRTTVFLLALLFAVSSLFTSTQGTIPVSAVGTVAVTMYRLYNPNSGEHFYTRSELERNHLASIGWQDEGVAWFAPEMSNIPVFRLYNPNAGDHHYTSSNAEMKNLISVGWTYEDIGWFSDEANGIPIYRQYNPNATGAGSHNYTQNDAEKNILIAAGWKDENIAWYGCDPGKVQTNPISSTPTPTPQDPVTPVEETPTSPITSEAPALEEEPDVYEADNYKTSANVPITEMKVRRTLKSLSAKNGIEPYSEYWTESTQTINGDISDDLGLASSLTISDKTKFARDSYIPAGYDMDKLIEWGKDPGLHVDVLKEAGYTGEGAVIAYIDQPIGEHEQYNHEKLHYSNELQNNSSMHGPAVLSLLAGKDIGTAPDAEVYFYTNPSWLADQTTHAERLYKVIEQNKSLPDDKKIRMVGFSDNIDPNEANVEAFEEAVKACEDAGIMVWFCGEYAPLTFIPMADKNNFDNVVKEHWWGNEEPELVYVPAAGRTTAATEGGNSYIYWGSGGLSWTMPYVLGLYADAIAIDPTLTKTDLRKLIVDTAYVSADGMKIINPVNFIATVLKKAGKTSEANALLEKLAEDEKYLYAIYNSGKMSSSDVSAMKEYLSKFTDSRVLLVDAANVSTAKDLYAALKADHQNRKGIVDGVQIFGTPDMVPAFTVNYKVMMGNGELDDAGTMQSDLFYGNFNNAAETIASGFSVYDKLKNGDITRLTPKWRVARLPLSQGQYKDFFTKYDAFTEDTGLETMDIVNFSNPIFASSYHSDDMGTFLKRADSEFGILDTTYRLYGNQKGQYPVENSVLGGFTKEEISKENAKGSCEFIINSHGQWNNIDNAFFVNGQEQRESFINMDTINTVLSKNAYYLDAWTCNNGYEMKNNLTTTALTGDCVGMFSATHIISNNGVKCNASLAEMQQSNFYYFYYGYLKALSEGKSRSQAFFEAQKEYGTALYADSKLPLRGEGNVQFNLNNLLTYHNFGVVEENAMAMAISTEIIH